MYNKNWEKVYEIPNLEIPEQYLPFVQDRGHLYHLYTDYFNDRDIYSTSPVELLKHFPSWEEVASSSIYEGYTEEDWSKKTHNLFREALEWFSSQPYSFQASWSY